MNPRITSKGEFYTETFTTSLGNTLLVNGRKVVFKNPHLIVLLNEYAPYEWNMAANSLYPRNHPYYRKNFVQGGFFRDEINRYIYQLPYYPSEYELTFDQAFAIITQMHDTFTDQQVEDVTKELFSRSLEHKIRAETLHDIVHIHKRCDNTEALGYLKEIIPDYFK